MVNKWQNFLKIVPFCMVINRATRQVTLIFYQVLRYIYIIGWKVMNLGKKVPLSLVCDLECSNSIVLLRSQRKFGPLFVAY